MRGGSLIALVLALLMGGVAALLSHNWLQSHARSDSAVPSAGSIVVAKEALAFGTELSADNVVEIPWAAEALPEGAFARKDELLRGGRRVVLSPFERSEPVLLGKVTGPDQRASLSTLLQVGKRAVTVRVDDIRGVAGFILPGDFVDVVLIADEGPPRRENYSSILLRHVRVLAIDQLASERQEHPTVAKAVTIEVTTEEAQKVLLASSIGKLSLILRRPIETGSDADLRITERDLAGFRSAPPPAPSPPPPPAQTAKPVPKSNTVQVSIIRNLKREEYSVVRSSN